MNQANSKNKSAATGEQISAVRRWIVTELNKEFPLGTTVTSNRQGDKFSFWTGMTQSYLENTWIKEKEKRDRGESAPMTTSCSSFLSQVIAKAGAANGIQPRKVLMRDGSYKPLALRSFNLHLEKGWVLFTGDNMPKPGDFFQLGTTVPYTNVKHVGVVLETQFYDLSWSMVTDKSNLPPANPATTVKMWGTVEGGQGGPGQKPPHDSIKRKGPSAFPPGSLMGWLDIDVFLTGWQGVG